MIDLYSDTLTRPTSAMRQAMAAADVGDEQRREDPTTNKLQNMVADLLGKEAAVFLPSGAMCNAVAIKTHTQPGEAILCDRMSHVYRSEFGGAAFLSGVTTEPIDGPGGIFSAGQVRQALSRFTAYGAAPRVLCLEQTHNFGGGTIWPLEQMREVCQIAHDHGMITHLDGARLFNACVASGTRPADYAASFDSIWIDLSKGLGCPVGAVLAGSKEFIARAWRYKHTFGGAMRQSGILAAAGVFALENNIERLREDHRNAAALAEGLAKLPGIHVENPKPQTNIVFFDIAQTGRSAADFARDCEAAGVRFWGSGTRLRAVTHLDISPGDIKQALAHVAQVLARKRS